MSNNTKAIYSRIYKSWIPLFRESADSSVWHFVYALKSNGDDGLYLACDEGLALAIANNSRDQHLSYKNGVAA